jgi:hypothetical protein
MQKATAAILGIFLNNISMKATTTEGRDSRRLGVFKYQINQ